MVEPGRRMLGSRYQLISLMATGGMGQVWRAQDTWLHRPVAVKVLRSEYAGEPTFVARFRAEAQHTAALAHRNIATLHDYGEQTAQDGTGKTLAYLVMELVEGESLSTLLAREGRLEVARTLDVLRQTAAGLASAHAAGVVHRDVKPSNVLVGADGIVKITDFGIAWSASSVPLTQTGQVVGTAHYLSPEQAAGSKATPASDVYALGMIGYECLAGRRAFDGENSVQIALRQLRDVPDPLPEDVPATVRRLIDRALVKDPAERFADGAAFRDAVDDVLAGRTLPPVASGTSPFPSAGLASGPRRPRRRTTLVSALALAVGAGIGVTALQLLGGPAAQPPVAAAGTVASPSPARIVLAADRYVGRPVADVEAELGALGLQVERSAQETTSAAPGTVTGVAPTGAVAPGDRITVFYAAAPSAPAPSRGNPAPAAPVGGQGSTGALVAVPLPAPSARVAAQGGEGRGRSAPPGSRGGGNGHGNGHGKDD